MKRKCNVKTLNVKRELRRDDGEYDVNVWIDLWECICIWVIYVKCLILIYVIWWYLGVIWYVRCSDIQI